MSAAAFVRELEAFKAERLGAIIGVGRLSMLPTTENVDPTRLLQIALTNELSVTDLAATWLPSTPEIDVRIAFARQAGDEAGHFQLVADRLSALGFDAAGFQAPPENPLFRYLKGLSGTVARVAAGLFTLESLAYSVNENFMAYCESRGDAETVRIYREFIQPDERAHQQLGHRLLEKYATTAELQGAARETVAQLLELAATTRAQAAARIGTACIPGC